MRSGIGGATFVSLWGIFFLLTTTVAHAATAAELQRQIEAQNQSIKALEQEIAQYERELTSVSANKKTLENAVKEIDLSKKKVTTTIAAEERKIVSTGLQIEQLDSDITTKEASIETSSHALAGALRRIQYKEDESLVETLLAQGSLGDVWDDLGTTQQFQEAVRGHVASLKETKEGLEESLSASTKKHQELLAYQKNLVAQKQALEVTQREKDSLLSKTKKEESSYQKLLAEKRAAKEAFEQAMNDLESQLAYTVDPSRIPPAGKGILRWPLSNVRITQKFGNTAFAQSGAYNGKGHNGVDFGVSVGTSVMSALSGTIAGTGNTDAFSGCYSYGKWVLVRHNNGLSTLYAHLSSILVSPGDTVETGDIIGLSGNTGYSTGPHLHFSVYVSEAVQIRKLGELKTKTNCAQAAIPVAPFEAYLNPLEYL